MRPPEEYLSVDENRELAFANLLLKHLPPIKTCGHKWFVCGKGCWAQKNKDVFRPVAHRLLPASARKTSMVRNVLGNIEDRLQIDEADFRGALLLDGDSVLLNCDNGIVRVTCSDITLLPHCEDHLFTRRILAGYHPSEKSPLFEKVLADCLPDEEDRHLFSLCAGNFLYPSSRYEVALVCYGTSGSGKSTIAEAVASVFGDGLVTRLNMSQICDPKSFVLPKLKYAAVNIGTELDSLAVDESANFKTIVSGEAIEAREIYDSSFTMHSSCKLWFLANELPRFKNGTEAEQRRMRFLRFSHKPALPDVTLKSRLCEERAGVFNYLLHGLRSLLSTGTIPLGGKQSREVHDHFAISNDPLGAFLAEHCILSPKENVRKEALGKSYTEFCVRRGLPEQLSIHFFRKLYNRHPELKPERTREGKDRLQMISGLSLRDTI